MARIYSLFWVAALFSLAGCGPHKEKQNADVLINNSRLGDPKDWQLDPRLNIKEVRKIRERAYQFCIDITPGESNCLLEQDESIFAFANNYKIYRNYQKKAEPSNEIEAAFKHDPQNFVRVEEFCYRVYRDNGSKDARMLGPCMAAGLQTNYFSFVSPG